MSRFTNEIKVRSIGNKWELFEGFTFYFESKGKKESILIPKGFVTDFASTPRILYPFFPPIGKYNKAALVHDFLYSSKSDKYNISRKKADQFFLQAMEVLGVSKKRYLMYLAVRLFGKLSFKK